MLRTQRVCLACSVAVFVCLVAAPAAAQPSDKRTLFTFSGPVAMPGTTFPAGQYLFRLASPDTSSNVVQVLSADGTKPYGLFFSIPIERVEPTSMPEVRFMETPAGTPAAIKTWWYPGQRTGYEFIYPKEQARDLAKGASEPVLTTQEQTTRTEQTNTGDLSRITSSGQETQVGPSTATTASTPIGNTQQGQIASSSITMPVPFIPAIGGTAPASGRNAVAQSARAELPRTASPVPLTAMIGTLALMSAASLRYWSTRKR
jgi:hypothetical protein